MPICNPQMRGMERCIYKVGKGVRFLGSNHGSNFLGD